jgi:hypothetical protein
VSAFSPRQMFLLDSACQPLMEVFGWSTFLVGTAMQPRDGKAPRDIDVRTIAEDKRRTEANELHHGTRNPLGHRNLGNYIGDARPRDAKRARLGKIVAAMDDKKLTEALRQYDAEEASRG